jgi:hypothetical protein
LLSHCQFFKLLNLGISERDRKVRSFGEAQQNEVSGESNQPKKKLHSKKWQMLSLCSRKKQAKRRIL